jgi:hypothetical protein
VSTTDVSAIRLRHAAANAGLADGPNAKPTKMRHLCKSMQKAVQDTAGRLLAIIGISGPSPSGSTPVPEGFSRIQINHHGLCKNMQKAVQDAACRLAIIGISGPSPSGSTPVPEGFSRIQITHHELRHRVCGSPLVAIVSPLNFRMSTTDVSTIRLGHAAANAGLADGPNAKPTKMRHLCKNVQKAVQDTACRLLTIGTSGPSPSGSTPVPEGFSRMQITHHKLCYRFRACHMHSHADSFKSNSCAASISRR